MTIGAGATAITVAANTMLAGFGIWDREITRVETDTRVITTIENTLEAQQRQLDNIAKQIADTRKEFVTDGTRNNKIEIALFKNKLANLDKKINELPLGLDGSVNKKAINTAVQAAENRLAQRFSVQIGGLVDGAVSKSVENHIASAAITTNNSDVPIGSARKIHVAEKTCVDLPSHGKRFTIKVKTGTEFCINPSQLYMKVESIRSDGTVQFSGPKFGTYNCDSYFFISDRCVFGNQSGLKQYILRKEAVSKVKNQFTVDINFEEIPL